MAKLGRAPAAHESPQGQGYTITKLITYRSCEGRKLGGQWLGCIVASVVALAWCGQKGVHEVIMAEWMGWIVGYVVSFPLRKLPTYRTRAYSMVVSHTPPPSILMPSPHNKVDGCQVAYFLSHFSSFIFVFKFEFHLQIYNETSTYIKFLSRLSYGSWKCVFVDSLTKSPKYF